jgi:tRNA (guanosine-2'-O-)-methyltransferase
MTPARLSKIKQVLAQRQPDLTVITDHVHKGRNLSAIIRTCDAAGIQDITAVVEEDESYRAFLRAAMGSHQWVDVHKQIGLEAAIDNQKKQGFQVVAAHPGDGAKDFREIDYTKPTAILLGAELVGVSAEGLQLADELVVIPMMGMVASLNVSVAAAIILTEVQYQRQQAGLYNGPRITNKQYEELIFRWGYPRLAKFCQQRHIPYPKLSDDGDIIDTAEWRKAVDKSGAKTAARRKRRAGLV